MTIGSSFVISSTKNLIKSISIFLSHCNHLGSFVTGFLFPISSFKACVPFYTSRRSVEVECSQMCKRFSTTLILHQLILSEEKIN